MDSSNNMKWQCKKCNAMIDNCIDIDYHNDTMHPDFSNKYVFELNYTKRDKKKQQS